MPSPSRSPTPQEVATPSEDEIEKIKDTVRAVWPLRMPVFTTLKSVINIWRDLEEVPDRSEVVLRATGKGGTITQKDIDTYLEMITKLYTTSGLYYLFKYNKGLEQYLGKDEYDTKLASALSGAATSVQTRDTKSLQTDIFDYLRPSEKSILGFEMPAGSLPKSKRGLGNHTTARFLIPRKHLNAFEENPDEIISMFKKGATNFQLVAGEWPTFLYDEWVGWDPNNIRDGLFRGHVLIRVALRLFRNKTAANADRLGEWFDPNRRTPGPKCMLARYKVRTVSSGMIAYAALQTYVALSSMPHWGSIDGTFLLGEFYHIIMDVLSDPNDDWVKETLGWWQKKIFGEQKQASDARLPQKPVRSTMRTLYDVMKEQGTDSGNQESANRMYPQWIQRRRPQDQDKHDESDESDMTTAGNDDGPKVFMKNTGKISSDSAQPSRPIGSGEMQISPPIAPTSTSKSQQHSPTSLTTIQPLQIVAPTPTTSQTRVPILPLALPTLPTQPSAVATHTSGPGAADDDSSSNESVQNANEAEHSPPGPVDSAERDDDNDSKDNNSGSKRPTQDANEDDVPPTKRQKKVNAQVPAVAQKIEESPNGNGASGRKQRGKGVKGKEARPKGSGANKQGKRGRGNTKVNAKDVEEQAEATPKVDGQRRLRRRATVVKPNTSK